MTVKHFKKGDKVFWGGRACVINEILPSKHYIVQEDQAQCQECGGIYHHTDFHCVDENDLTKITTKADYGFKEKSPMTIKPCHNEKCKYYSESEIHDEAISDFLLLTLYKRCLHCTHHQPQDLYVSKEASDGNSG